MSGLRLLSSMLTIVLLAQSVYSDEWDTRKSALTGVDCVQVSAYIQTEREAVFGSSDLYRSLLMNKLAGSGIRTDSNSVNSVVLEFSVIVMEHTFAGTGGKSGNVSFWAELQVWDRVRLSRFDSTARIELPNLNAPIWERGSLGFVPDAFGVKVRLKELMEDWSEEFVAELRTANSSSTKMKIEQYWLELDSLISASFKR